MQYFSQVSHKATPRPRCVRGRPRRPLGDTGNDARIAVGRAIVDGLLLEHPSACSVCDTTGVRTEGGRWSIVWHHHSYAIAYHLDVVAVCRKCHGHIHAGHLPEPRTGVYRRLLHGARHDEGAQRALLAPIGATAVQPHRDREAA